LGERTEALGRKCEYLVEKRQRKPTRREGEEVRSNINNWGGIGRFPKKVASKKESGTRKKKGARTGIQNANHTKKRY